MPSLVVLQVPVMEVGGKFLNQSEAILRFVGSQVIVQQRFFIRRPPAC